jgi:hypothetical protein
VKKKKKKKKKKKRIPQTALEEQSELQIVEDANPNRE